MNFAEGAVLLINKPLEWTSFDVVKKIRTLIKIPKVGHAGTLDPLATGLLIVCTGKYTKKINEYMGMEKEYTGSFTLGATTKSYDLESEPEHPKETNHITVEQLHASCIPFIGTIQQMPPIFSAIKKDGKVAYIEARKGNDIGLSARTITIHSFEITKVEMPVVYFKIVCGTGTYIRSVAHDFGQALGVGAFLSSLCRTRIGDFSLENAYSIDGFKEIIGK